MAEGRPAGGASPLSTGLTVVGVAAGPDWGGPADAPDVLEVAGAPAGAARVVGAPSIMHSPTADPAAAARSHRKMRRSPTIPAKLANRQRGVSTVGP